MRRSRANPCCSNIATVPLCRKDDDDRAALGVFGIAFHRPSAETLDLLQRTGESSGRHAFAAIGLVDEETGDPPIRRHRQPFAIGARCLDARQLFRRPELAPADAGLAVEHQGGMSAAFATRACLSERFCAAPLCRSKPSWWKLMHQQPPQTPLCLSTSAAKSGHVVSSRGFVVKAAIVAPAQFERSSVGCPS